ncbi:MAG: glycosyltransferase [Spirulinaceae cyanobacterium]
MIENNIVLGLTLLSLLSWLGLLSFRGQFWRANQRLDTQSNELKEFPSVCAIIPARNEAPMLPQTLPSLLQQDYPGEFSLVLVDDSSSDSTGKIAQEIATQLNCTQRLKVILAEALPQGWTGKLWAMAQGIKTAQQQTNLPDYFLLTDADIQHNSTNLRQLVSKAEQENLDLVSVMVLLRCQSFWEQLLIPAFVFFFQKLYPFPWVNDSSKTIAAAAGGCILIHRQALQRIGGIAAIRQALIDDCALAEAIKSSSDGKKGIWLGLTDSTLSLRPYPSLASIWDMVTRTAYTQLNYSPWLLLGTLIAMTIIYLVPPFATIGGLLRGNWLMAIAGLSAWLLMSVAYLPTIGLYKRSPFLTLVLPGIALLYNLMTIDSALQHWQGKGGKWKGRVYP